MRLPKICIITMGICIIMLYSFIEYDRDMVETNKVLIGQKVNTIVNGCYLGDKFVEPKPLHTTEDYKILTLILALSYMTYCSYLWVQLKRA